MGRDECKHSTKIMEIQQRNQHWLAFDEKWFKKNQKTLLWLLNTPIVKNWFRWVLAIRTHDCPLSKDIEEIAPNRYTIDAGLRPYKLSQVYETISKDPARNRQMRRHAVSMLSKIKRGIVKDETKLLPSKTTDFRTHLKFAKRVYFAFKPMWWAMHIWDELFADRFAPQYGFGFSVLTAYPDPHPETSTVDGRVVQSGSNATWATIRDGAGDGARDDFDGSENIITVNTGTTTDRFSMMIRSIFLFDTSSITAPATISDAVFSIYGHTKSDTLSASPTVNIYSSNPASNTALAAGDFDGLGTTAYCDTAITYAGYALLDYNNFSFNATGIAAIAKTGISKFGLRNANYDVANSAPTWVYDAVSRLNAYFSDFSGTSSDPKLVVTYSTSIDVSTTVTTQASTFSIPTYSTSQGVTLSATTQGAIFSIPTYDTIQGLTVTPDTQIATFSIPTYDVLTPDALVVPTTQSATFSIPTYSALFDFAFGVTTQEATFSIPTYAVALGQTITPDTQAATFSIPTYSVGLGSLIEATTQEATFSVPAYSAFGEMRLIVSEQVATFSIPAYSVNLDMVISPDTQVATFSLPALYKVGAVWTKRARQTNSTWSRTSRNSN